jgi:hypothetical protein
VCASPGRTGDRRPSPLIIPKIPMGDSNPAEDQPGETGGRRGSKQHRAAAATARSWPAWMELFWRGRRPRALSIPGKSFQVQVTWQAARLADPASQSIVRSSPRPMDDLKPPPPQASHALRDKPAVANLPLGRIDSPLRPLRASRRASVDNMVSPPGSSPTPRRWVPGVLPDARPTPRCRLARAPTVRWNGGRCGASNPCTGAVSRPVRRVRLGTEVSSS